MFSLFRKKKVSFAGETAATILYLKWKDDTLPQYTNRSECLCYSRVGKELTNRSRCTGAPDLNESGDTGRSSNKHSKTHPPHPPTHPGKYPEWS